MHAQLKLSFESRLPAVLSYGGGLDSFAMLVDALARGVKPDAVVFCDVGDPEHARPGEWPSTYRHIDEVVKPLCAAHGIPFVTLDGRSYPVRDAESLFDWLYARHQIPVAGPARVCTTVAKVERFERWLNDTYPGREVEVWIGFEAGEEARADKDPNAGSRRKVEPGKAVRVNRFPLIERDLCRCRCEALVRSAGYPVPRKSACTFCPYASKGDWQTLARELPETFAAVADLEARKPLTKRGIKLSIMGFRSIKKDGKRVGYKAPPLPVYVEGLYKPKAKPCNVCGAAERATKATGCDYVA